ELLRANTELQQELQEEQDARKAMPEQLQPRDMTKEEVAKFVETIKGKVSRLSLFTVADPEATIFGITVLDSLRKADVSVTWFRMHPSPPQSGAARVGASSSMITGGEKMKARGDRC